MHLKQRLLLFVTLISLNSLFAQVTPEKLQAIINTGNSEFINNRNKNDLIQFYIIWKYQPVWIQSNFQSRCKSLLSLTQTAADRGLNEKNYQPEFIQSLIEGKIALKNSKDSIDTEIRLTSIALNFFNDVFYGNTSPAFGYNGLNYTPAGFNIAALLTTALQQNKLAELNENSYISMPEIKALRKSIQWIQKIITDSVYKEERITSTKVNADNKPLCKKLFYFGVIDSINKKLPDNEMKEKIKEAQKQFGLLADGVLRSTAFDALNIPLKVRLKQLNLSINYYRWLYNLSQQESVIVVNIPAAYLKVYYQGSVVTEMKMIVGKPSTPTPTLSSRVQQVILYPYWTVPYSIATKELLPSIKKNPGFIDAGNYQVLNKQGKIMNPYAIDWSSCSAKNFPYIIRQSTGCDNALGLIKLDFYSPFGVYLHDTPNKSLFILNKRFFSHGCMRMGDPMKLGHLVMKNNLIAIDTLEQKGCLRNQHPIYVPADVRMPVIVWYNPAGIDPTGRVIYYEDVYKKLAWMKER